MGMGWKPDRAWTAAALLCLASPFTAHAVSPQWTLEGFHGPESVFVIPLSHKGCGSPEDDVRGALVVSNVGNAPTEKDGDGFLSCVSADGEMLQRNWINGFDSPHAMAMTEGQLLVADIGQVHIVDIERGQILRSVPAPGAGVLNGAVGDGYRVWLTDVSGDTIYLYEDGEVSPWLTDERLVAGNGLALREDTLYVGLYGEGIGPDFKAEHPGDLLRVDLETKHVDVVAYDVAAVDGVTVVGGKVYISDFNTGRLLLVDADGASVELLRRVPGLADFSISNGFAYVPLFLDDRIEALPVTDVIDNGLCAKGGGSADLPEPARLWFEAGEALSREPYAQAFTPDGTLVMGSAPAVTGRAEIAQAAQMTFDRIDGLSHDLQCVQSLGRVTLVEGVATYSVSGDKVSVPLMAVMRLNMSGTLLEEARLYVDLAPLEAMGAQR